MLLRIQRGWHLKVKHDKPSWIGFNGEVVVKAKFKMLMICEKAETSDCRPSRSLVKNKSLHIE